MEEGEVKANIPYGGAVAFYGHSRRRDATHERSDRYDLPRYYV